MTEASKEPEKTVDVGTETIPANTIEQPEELVRRKVVRPLPVAADESEDGDRSPGGSGRVLIRPEKTTPPLEGE